MNDILGLTVAAIAGVVLGLFYFGGLWWTIQQGITSQRPATWFLFSLLLRTSLVLFGFYFVAQGHWSRLAAGLATFLAARILVVKRLAKVQMQSVVKPESETGHAPYAR